MHVLFSRNEKCGSKLISWASSKEHLTNVKVPPSHVAVLIDDTIVVESTLSSGVRMLPYNSWSEINEELYKIECDCPNDDIKGGLELVWGKKYDWMGILYFAWRYLGLILLKKPLPSVNRWQSSSKYFCTEYAGLILGKKLSMISPAKLCDELLES